MNYKLAGAAALWISAAAIAMAQERAPAPNTPPLPVTVTLSPVAADVASTDQQLLNSDKDQDNWLLHGRTYDNQRFSPLTQVNQKNVSQLRPVAIIQTGIARSFEVTPTVVNGVMYIITPGDTIQTYDAVSGRPLWNYTPTLAFSNVCCGPEARGVTAAYGKVFAALLDGSVVALDAKTGDVVWKTDPEGTLPP